MKTVELVERRLKASIELLEDHAERPDTCWCDPVMGFECPRCAWDRRCAEFLKGIKETEHDVGRTVEDASNDQVTAGEAVG